MNSSQRISEKIEERMMAFSVDVIGLVKQLPNTPENEIIRKQLVRSSSSIGANYIEANNAASKVDFRNKIFIAKKEAAETRYWLRILVVTNPGLSIDHLLDECSQFLFILQKIISSLKNAKLKA
jgi:four helix bundle protein